MAFSEIGRILKKPEALETLRSAMDGLLAVHEAIDPQDWRRLFESASALRDRLLLDRIDVDRLLFVKRKPFISEQPYMDAHHCFNRPGGGIYSLSPVRPTRRDVRPIEESLGEGIYRDLCLHWDGTRILFAFGNGSDRAKPLPGESLDRVDPKQNYNISRG